MKHGLRLAALLLALTLKAAAQERETVEFTLQHTTPFGDWRVYVLGDVAELGGGDIRNALEMRIEDGVWRISVSLPVNLQYTYQFWERLPTLANIRNPSHGTQLTGVLSGQTSTVNLSPRSKRAIVLSTLPQPVLHWRQDDGPFHASALVPAGPGRTPGERRWLGFGLGAARRTLEFYLTDESGALREPPQENIRTALDAFVYQDGNLFNYLPAGAVTQHRRDYDVAAPPSINSVHLNEMRHYRVLLPRGYDQHPSRRYPVIYWHDGASLWETDSWNPALGAVDLDGERAGPLVRWGNMAECIQVGVQVPGATLCEFARHRIDDYIPPGNNASFLCPGVFPGQADRYVNFLIEELKPVIDANYRTRPGRDDTFTGGASFGGVVSLYMSWDYGDTFGGAVSWSGSNIANLLARIRAEPVRPVKIYIDSGEDNWSAARNYFNALINRSSQPLVASESAVRYFQLGAQHTWHEFGERLPRVAEFLFPATRDAAEVPVPADLNGDLRVDLSDLASLLSAYGGAGTSTSDLDGDNDVDLDDLALMLGLFGIDASKLNTSLRPGGALHRSPGGPIPKKASCLERKRERKRGWNVKKDVERKWGSVKGDGPSKWTHPLFIPKMDSSPFYPFLSPRTSPAPNAVARCWCGRVARGNSWVAGIIRNANPRRKSRRGSRCRRRWRRRKRIQKLEFRIQNSESFDVPLLCEQCLGQ